jgi:stress response protein SCP2
VTTDLVPGANLTLPDARVTIEIRGPYDVSALVVDESGQVSGDADMIFYNAPSGPGVSLRGPQVVIEPARLRRGAARVVVVASPDDGRSAFGSLPAPATTVLDARGATIARLRPPPLSTETVLVVAEVYRRGDEWRLRSLGQGYADGLAGLARDYGVEVDDDGDSTAGPLADVVAATNAERARHGLAPLTVDARLTAAAQAHSADMVARSFFAHENPDGSQVWDRALAAGYAYRKVAENIAAGQRSAAEVVVGWMNSPGHRRNILDPELTQIGVGTATGGEYGIHWTQVFGTPR